MSEGNTQSSSSGRSTPCYATMSGSAFVRHCWPKYEGSIIAFGEISTASLKFEAFDFYTQIRPDEHEAEATGVPFTTAFSVSAAWRADAVYLE